MEDEAGPSGADQELGSPTLVNHISHIYQRMQRHAHLDLKEVADQAVGGHALSKRALCCLALLGASSEFGKEVI